MQKSMTLPGRGELRPTKVSEERALILAYGRHYSIKRWEQRTEDQQNRITAALTAFRGWRIKMGESFQQEDPWAMPPPNAATLRLYLTHLSVSSVCWRDNSVAALRLYFLHTQDPALFRMVKKVKHVA